MVNRLAFAGLIALAAAEDPAGVLRFSITGVVPTSYGNVRRQDDVDLKKQLDGTSYTIELGLGTPAQSVVVQLDTGSTDFWVNPNCANINTATSTSFCNSLPRFTPADSSTFKSLGETYQLRYGSGNASIDWATETVTLGAGKITAQQFGVASDSFSEPFGILGIGPNIGGTHPQYSFFIDTLATQGLTASRAFSLDLRGIESTDGSIIFGGIDTKRYSGALEKLPIIPESEAPDGNRYWVSLDGIDLVSGSGVSTAISSTPIAVLLDSGSTMSTLPVAVFNAIAKSFPTATLDAGSGLYTVDCAVTSQAGTVDFTFAGKTIKVAYKDFVWHAGSFCVLGVEGSDTAIPILGDTFLRAAFVVFDQDNQNIHIAQAADCGSNLVAITKGADAVPSLVGDCGASSSTSSVPSSSTATESSGSTSATATSTGTSASSTAPGSDIPSSTPLTITSTIKKTTVYTVTKCPETVTDCPVGHVTTEVITEYTTYCPETETGKPHSTAPYPSGTTAGPIGTGTITVARSTTTAAAATTTRAVTAGAGKVLANAGAGLAAVVAIAML